MEFGVVLSLFQINIQTNVFFFVLIKEGIQIKFWIDPTALQSIIHSFISHSIDLIQMWN